MRIDNVWASRGPRGVRSPDFRNHSQFMATDFSYAGIMSELGGGPASIMRDAEDVQAVLDGVRARDRHADAIERVMLRHAALTVTYDPLEFHVGGQEIMLAPMESAILELLARRGRASAAMLAEMFEREGGSVRTLDVLVHRIRQKFAAKGAGDPIQTVRGWGLKLRTED